MSSAQTAVPWREGEAGLAGWLVRVADRCWMAVTGGLVSLVLGVFCLVFDGLGLVGRMVVAGFDLVRRPASGAGGSRPFRTIALTVVVLAAAFAVIQITAELIEGYNSRRSNTPEAFDANRPARQAREPGRAVTRTQLGKAWTDSD
jgi:hypothetical protein